jgi:hypothetical protein
MRTSCTTRNNTLFHSLFWLTIAADVLQCSQIRPASDRLGDHRVRINVCSRATPVEPS